MVEWSYFEEEPSVEIYLTLVESEKKMSFLNRLLEQLGVRETCSVCGKQKTVKGGYDERLICPEKGEHE